MERREALKNLGWSLGLVVGTPTLLQMLQSCKTETPWQPVFLNMDQGKIISKLIDIILPVTDTPGALEVNVPQFVDVYIKEVFKSEEQNLFLKGYETFINTCLVKNEISESQKLSTEMLELGLSDGFLTSNEAIEKANMATGKYMQALKENKVTALDAPVAIFSFLSTLRSLSIFGFKSSELIGEEILSYDPIPGGYQGCVDLKTATNGLAWSLYYS